MPASEMVFKVLIFCVAQLGYCQEDHMRMGHLDTSQLASALSKSNLSADTQAEILNPLSDMRFCEDFLRWTTAATVAEVAGLYGKLISYHCAYEVPGPSYAIIRHYNGRVERKIISGAE
jgi:hypothetical protein